MSQGHHFNSTIYHDSSDLNTSWFHFNYFLETSISVLSCLQAGIQYLNAGYNNNFKLFDKSCLVCMNMEDNNCCVLADY